MTDQLCFKCQKVNSGCSCSGVIATRTMPNDEQKACLAYVAGMLQAWIIFDGEQPDDKHIMCPPAWPSHGQVKKWIKTLKAVAGVTE